MRDVSYCACGMSAAYGAFLTAARLEARIALCAGCGRSASSGRSRVLVFGSVSRERIVLRYNAFVKERMDE